ncbi:MAG: SIS domain-containing protein [Sphingomonas adhaesiva]|uniref:SIS domain-containing protein n=1 Tax=Sphingomonas adhaesiva TaxID=28212 RepID=UPI002FF62D82
MTGSTTLMRAEMLEAPLRVREQLTRNADLVRAAGERLRALGPPFAATLARGSSDQAAAFAKVLLETRAGVPVLSHSPSIGSLYHATSPRFAGVPLIAISQSGKSPDLIAAAQDAQAQGAVVVAIVNDAASPLATLADIAIPVHAGAERSVAATKSLIATLVALVHLAAEWSGDAGLRAALATVADRLDTAAAQDWGAAIPLLTGAASLLVLGRGPTLPIAGEAALKLKETSGLHAEAFSVAEVAHGPMTLIGAGDPVLVFAPADAARAGVAERIADFAARGARVIATGPADAVGGATLVLPAAGEADDPVVAAIAELQAFYGLAEHLARARGRDPDQPPHLAKVTRTL